MALPSDAKARKEVPIATGVLDYFPDALAEVAHVSVVGNQQHNPGQPLHWAKGKSTDHSDSLMRHLVDRGKIDSDGVRHSAKVAWRALALLQTELEQAQKNPAMEGWDSCHKPVEVGPISGGNIHDTEFRQALRDTHDTYSIAKRALGYVDTEDDKTVY